MPNAKQIADYQSDGFLLVEQLFCGVTLAPLREALAQDYSLGGECFEMLDVDGATLDAIAWLDKSNTLLGLLPFARRTVDVASALLGEEVYHWHSKLTIKRPHNPARVEWHQDYGAWYYEGCLAPSLITVAVAIEPSTTDNGCLRFIRGSHRLGRLEHEYLDDAQHRVEPERLAIVASKLETVDVELAVGDAVFFHCNTLHGSSGNCSDHYRTLLLSTYNAASNSPFGASQQPRCYRPMPTVGDSVFADRRYDAAIAGHRFSRPNPQQMHGFGANAFD